MTKNAFCLTIDPNIPGPKDASASVITKVKLLSRWSSCFFEPLDKDWQDITGLVKYIGPNTMDIRVNQLIPVICMKLLILETRHDQEVRIKGVTATYMAHVGTQYVLAKDWSGDAPSMSSFCRKKVDKPIPAMANSCKTRQPDALYDFHSGFVTCHCDQFCSKFNDCCSDFSSDARLRPSNVSSAADFNPSDQYLVSCETPQFPLESHPGIGVYVVSSCLAHLEDTAYGRECLGSGNLAFIPVESRGVVFRNVFCALCNNVPPSNITPWQPSVWYTDEGTTRQCQQEIELVLSQVLTNATPDLNIDCFNLRPKGFARPRDGDMLRGPNRLGKLCFIPQNGSNTTATGTPAFLLQEANRVSAVTDPRCFCDHCHPRMLVYLTADMSKIADFFLSEKIPWLYMALKNDFTHDGGFSGIFLPSSTKLDGKEEKGEEDEREQEEIELDEMFITESDNEKDDEASSEKKLSFRLISLIGSGSSALLLSGILFHLIQNGTKSTEAKRIQIGILAGKILMFVAFMGRYLFRRYSIACKIFAIMVHYAMYVSFGNMIWFGLSVAKLLWSVENNMAGLSMENKNDDIRNREWILWGIIWLGFLGLVIGFWSYDTFLDASFFVYGRNEICLMAGPQAVLYLLVVPTTIIVISNFGLIIYCVTQYLRLMDQRTKTGKNLLIFLARLMVFQTSQWGFGIVYYFTSNILIQYIFEVSIAFEGTFIAITRHMFRA